MRRRGIESVIISPRRIFHGGDISVTPQHTGHAMGGRSGHRLSTGLGQEYFRETIARDGQN